MHCHGAAGYGADPGRDSVCSGPAALRQVPSIPLKSTSPNRINRLACPDSQFHSRIQSPRHAPSGVHSCGLAMVVHGTSDSHRRPGSTNAHWISSDGGNGVLVWQPRMRDPVWALPLRVRKKNLASPGHLVGKTLGQGTTRVLSSWARSMHDCECAHADEHQSRTPLRHMQSLRQCWHPALKRQKVWMALHEA